LGTAEWLTAVAVGGVALADAFPAGSPPERSAQLSVRQRTLVEAIAGSPGWGLANFSLMVTDFGLPGSADDCARWLNGAALNDCRPVGLRRR
jgi:hypothetical protein